MQLAASSLAPGLQIRKKTTTKLLVNVKKSYKHRFKFITFQLLNQNDNLALEYDYVTNYSDRFHAIKQ